jgi:hypothetical protein
MKRMGIAGVLGALTLSLIVPGAVSATELPTFGAQVDTAKCTNRGGQHGFGRVKLQMQGFARNDVAGKPTPNYIVVRGSMEQKIDGVWVDVSGATTTTSQTYPDGTVGVFNGLLGLGWAFESADHPRTRIVMRVEFWDDLPTGDVRVAKISARTAGC